MVPVHISLIKFPWTHISVLTWTSNDWSGAGGIEPKLCTISWMTESAHKLSNNRPEVRQKLWTLPVLLCWVGEHNPGARSLYRHKAHGRMSGMMQWALVQVTVLCADLGSEVKTQRSKVNLILSVRVSGNEDTAAIFIDVSFKRSCCCAFLSLGVCPVFLFSALLQTLYRRSHNSR